MRRERMPPLIAHAVDEYRCECRAHGCNKRLHPERRAPRRVRKIDQEENRKARARIHAEETRACELVARDRLKDRARDRQSRADDDGEHGAHHAEVEHRQILLRRPAAEQDARDVTVAQLRKSRTEMHNEHNGEEHRAAQAVQIKTLLQYAHRLFLPLRIK